MFAETVVFLGSQSQDLSVLARSVQDFGWSHELVANFDDLRSRRGSKSPAAVLVDADSLGSSWEEALRCVRETHPEALIVACYRFSDVVNWPDLAAAGAFHALAMPFDSGEVRQSLAYVWSARFQKSVKVLATRRAVTSIA